MLLVPAVSGCSSGGEAYSADDGRVEVTYIATGNVPTAAVRHRTPDGKESAGGLPLPFRTTFRLEKDDSTEFSVKTGYERAGKVTCTVVVDGRIVRQTTVSGAYRTASCGGPVRAMQPVAGARLPSLSRAAGRVLPITTRLTKVVPVPRYPGAGSPVKARIAKGATRLSYAELGGGWEPSVRDDMTNSAFERSQQLTTESRWRAVVASGIVPDEVLDEATGRPRLPALASALQDERQQGAFPSTTRGRDIASQPFKVSGRPAWVRVREMHVHKPGLLATMDLSVVVVVDTGAPAPSFLWIDLPDTHRHLWPDVNTLIGSLRVT
ncbi:hypothetical protein [Spirillospora albida]|uniref:hypothetical protein n=1 Tax=Spirillospora albida TaxID=58123 RepID=UPI00068FC27C|nr:hypothetical protein [Spirillospora albida]